MKGAKNVVEVVESKEMAAGKAVNVLVGIIREANTVSQQKAVVELLHPIQVAFDEMNARVAENKKRRMLVLSQIYGAWKLGGKEMATKVMQLLGEDIDLEKFVPWYEAELRLAEAKKVAEAKAAAEKSKAKEKSKGTTERSKKWVVSWNDVVVPQPSPYAAWRTAARQGNAREFFENGDVLKGRFDYAAFKEAYNIDQRGEVTISGVTYVVKHVNDDVTSYKVADGFIS